MKAHLRSVRIAPKKLNLIAKMVRGMPVPEALEALKHTHKKGARIVQELLKSAVANAEHNDKQQASLLIIKTIVVNQASGYRRGVPKARGSVRPVTKFLSHVSLALGFAGEEGTRARAEEAKEAKSASQRPKNPVKGSSSRTKKAGMASSRTPTKDKGGSDSSIPS